MADHWNKKDYGEYFRDLERSTYVKSARRTPPKTAKKRSYIRAWTARLIAVLIIIGILCGIVFGLGALFKALFGQKKTTAPKKTAGTSQSASTPVDEPAPTKFSRTDNTVELDEKFKCNNAVVIDLSTNRITAAREENTRVSPASLTKVMTALVATDLIDDYNKTFVMTKEITDATFLAKATNVGFAVGEEVTMTDLLYGSLMPSGADATLGLAEALCGSEAAFVEKMNEKAAALGLENTHFTNVTGLYGEDHYSSAADFAVITAEALKVPLLKQIMSTVDYTTAPTPQHPEGIALNGTLFSYMYGTEPEGATILAGKTGFVNESGYCFTTYGEADGGKPYLLVMMGGKGKWPSVFELIDLYSTYVK